MSLTINQSSESMTQFHLPISFIMSNSQIEDPQFNSFSSPRSDSVTVIGKKLFSLSCISPKAAEEPTRFPIPIQSITRAHYQKSQAKVLLKHKKNLKIKTQDQPAPVPKPAIKLTFSIPQIKELQKQKVKNKKKPQEKLFIIEKPKQIVPQTERSNVRMNQLLKKSAIFEIKKKKKEKKTRVLEQKKKVEKKNRMIEKNSQIRVENLVKFKKEKFSPRAAWGVGERKIVENEKVMRDIEIQRAANKMKISEVRSKKGGIGLSKFWEVSEELGFKPRSSSSNPIELPKPVIRIRKESKKKVKKFMKNQKKKEKEKKENQIIEEIQKETKRLIYLKELNGKNANSHKVKKINDRLKVQFRPKKIGFLQETEDELGKIYADKSSEFYFEPESHLREEISAFSEDSMQMKTPNKPQSDEKLYKIESAVLKLQYFYRKYIKKPLKSALPQQNSKHRSESFPSSTQESAPKAEEASTKNENPSDLQPTDPQQDPSLNSSLSDSITEDQQKRYESLTEILQSSTNLRDYSFKVNSENIEIYQQELQEVKEIKIPDFSFDSYISSSDHSKDQVLIKDEEEAQEKELNLNLNENNPDSRNIYLVSRASPISDCEEVNGNKEINEKCKNVLSVMATDVWEITENIIERLLVEIINSDSGVKKVISIDKDPLPFVDQLVFHIPPKEFQSNLSKPIKKNPLEVLANLQNTQKFYSNTFDAFSVPVIIPHSTFNEIQSFKLESLLNQDLKEAQKIHDKLIFDNCNELLQSFRPYGSEGLPLPWSSSKRVLKKSNYQVVKILPKIARKIEMISLFNAGKISDPDSEMFSLLPTDTLQNVRDEKIGLLILQDIENKEPTWTEYEYEETQTIINLSDMLLIDLIIDTLRLV